MKKFLITILYCLVVSNPIYTAVKVNFSFGNFRITSGYWTVDISAQVLIGQTWRVGSSNIRVEWVSIPPNAISVKAENPYCNPNPNIHSNANYSAMTMTSISGGTAISLNITRLNNCYLLTPGTYVLGSIRFNRLDTTTCVRLNIRSNSAIQDSMTQLLNPIDWTATIDTISYRIDYLTGIAALNEMPKVFRLYNNYPNPFNPNTLIRFDIAKLSYTSLTVYDVLGQEIAKLVNEKLKPGKYETQFEGSKCASGVYYYKLVTEYYTETKKMVLLK